MQPAFKSGDIWVTYTWQDAYVSMTRREAQGRLPEPEPGASSAGSAGSCSAAKTKNYFHAHKYVESFINHKAVRADDQPVLLRDTRTRPSSASEIQDPDAGQAARTSAIRTAVSTASDVHLQSFQPNRAQYELAWQEVLAA